MKIQRYFQGKCIYSFFNLFSLSFFVSKGFIYSLNQPNELRFKCNICTTIFNSLLCLFHRRRLIWDYLGWESSFSLNCLASAFFKRVQVCYCECLKNDKTFQKSLTSVQCNSQKIFFRSFQQSHSVAHRIADELMNKEGSIILFCCLNCKSYYLFSICWLFLKSIYFFSIKNAYLSLIFDDF